MEPNDEVAKLKDQLARAMRGYQLLKQQADKQGAELSAAQQSLAAAEKKASQLTAQNVALQGQLDSNQGNLNESWGERDDEELELANARLSETTLQLESVQQELEQQQQQAADRISSLNKQLEAKEHAQSCAVELAVRQEREAFEAASALHVKADRELGVLRGKVTELEESTMLKTEEAMTAMSKIEDLELALKTTTHNLDLAKAELAMRDKELQTCNETTSALKSAKLQLEERVNELEQQLTFTSQDRDKYSAEKDKLNSAGTEQAELLKEAEEELAEQRKHHEAAIAALKDQLLEAQAEASHLKEELGLRSEEHKNQLVEHQSSKESLEMLQAENVSLLTRVKSFDQELEDQQSQHKLNEKKNVKTIRELKSELLKAIEQKKIMEAELKAQLELCPEKPMSPARNRSATVGEQSPTSSRVQSELNGAAPDSPSSLCDANFHLETQLEEAQAEIQKKEEMLQFYMRNAPAKGLTSVESDMVMMQAELQHEEIKCSAGGLWGMFGGAKVPKVDGEVHHKLKVVLEETLLENIRLKQDVDAMGQEVARLADEISAKK